MHDVEQLQADSSAISILATGGTIAGRPLREGSVAEYVSGDVPVEEILASVPGLDSLAAIRYRQVANIDSGDMTEEVWLALARAVADEAARPEVRGVVVLHGTDTMEETAVFLDLVFAGTKPVVMTGAMRPAGSVSADGPGNILAAARIALSPESAGRGVLVTMNDLVHHARFATKGDTMSVNAFRSVGAGPEGRVIDGEVVYFRPAHSRETCPRFDVSKLGELPRVEIVYGHAGQERLMAEAAVASGAWGVVHAGMGIGNMHSSVRPVLVEAAASGIVVVCASRVGEGPVPVTEKNRRDGFVSAGMLNPHKARVVLQLALTTMNRARDIQKVFDLYARG